MTIIEYEIASSLEEIAVDSPTLQNVTVPREALARQLAKYYRVLDKKRCKCAEFPPGTRRECIDDYATTNLKMDPATQLIRCETCITAVEYIKALRHNHSLQSSTLLGCEEALRKDMCDPFYDQRHSMGVACRSVIASLCILDVSSLNNLASVQTTKDFCTMTEYCLVE